MPRCQCTDTSQQVNKAVPQDDRTTPHVPCFADVITGPQTKKKRGADGHAHHPSQIIETDRPMTAPIRPEAIINILKWPTDQLTIHSFDSDYCVKHAHAACAAYPTRFEIVFGSNCASILFFNEGKLDRFMIRTSQRCAISLTLNNGPTESGRIISIHQDPN